MRWVYYSITFPCPKFDTGLVHSNQWSRGIFQYHIGHVILGSQGLRISIPIILNFSGGISAALLLSQLPNLEAIAFNTQSHRSETTQDPSIRCLNEHQIGPQTPAYIGPSVFHPQLGWDLHSVVSASSGMKPWSHPLEIGCECLHAPAASNCGPGIRWLTFCRQHITVALGQNGPHFVDNIFKRIFLNEICCILILNLLEVCS